MIHGNGGHIRAFALAWTICGKHSLFSRFVCGLSDDTAAGPDTVCRMVAVPGGCRTLSHLHFDVERSVCFAVDRVWETEREALRSIAKYPLKREPLPSEFIAILAAYIKNGDAA